MKNLMKLVALALSLGLVGGAFADTTNGTVIASDVIVKSVTTAVATSVATQVAALTSNSGLAIDRGGGVAVVVCAEATRTITSGNMRAYVYMPVFEPKANGTAGVDFLWFPFPTLDFAVGGTSQRCHASGDKQSFSGIGRIIWLPDTVVVSAGTTVVATHSVRKGMPK
jgi:hypothetical protein